MVVIGTHRQMNIDLDLDLRKPAENIMVQIMLYSQKKSSLNLEKLGFTEFRRSDPGYVWVDLYTDRAYNRYNTQKQNIRKFLHDDTIDLSKSEKKIMEEHGSFKCLIVDGSGRMSDSVRFEEWQKNHLVK